jgi:tetratricopeptide (TPR) repeat protein
LTSRAGILTLKQVRRAVPNFEALIPLGTRRIAILLLLIGLAAPAILSGCISEPKRHFDRARILFDRRDLKGAKLELKKAIAADPEMLEAHKLLARVDEYLGDSPGAAAEYETAARLDPADPKLRYKARFYRDKVEHRSAPAGRADPTSPPLQRYALAAGLRRG